MSRNDTAVWPQNGFGKEGKPVRTAVEPDFPITCDTDPALGYETKRWLYRLSLPFMYVIICWVMFKKVVLGIKPNDWRWKHFWRYILRGFDPSINSFFFDGCSRRLREVKERAASWRALDLIYNHPFDQNNWITNFWFRMINAQAVRNRSRLIKRELKDAILRLTPGGKSKITLLSLASGSAESILQVIKEVADIVQVDATFVDIDPTAIEHSQQLAISLGLEKNCIFICTALQSYLNRLNYQPDIIEMVGFLDYRPTEKAIYLIRDILKKLANNGFFLTANIIPNPERLFLEVVIEWKMIYRTSEELGRMLAEAGLSISGFEPTFRLLVEPLGLYTVAVCSKDVLPSS